jgi:hypothetical protein
VNRAGVGGDMTISLLDQIKTKPQFLSLRMLAPLISTFFRHGTYTTLRGAYEKKAEAYPISPVAGVIAIRLAIEVVHGFKSPFSMCWRGTCQIVGNVDVDVEKELKAGCWLLKWQLVSLVQVLEGQAQIA